MSEAYREAFRQKLATEPWRHIARVAEFQIRRLDVRRWRDERALHRARRAGGSVISTGSLLRPPPHRYQGYAGPWIEDAFFRHWVKAMPRTELVYVPVFWTDLYLHAQTHRFLPRQEAAFSAEIRDLLDRRLADERMYFTVLEYDHTIWDWHLFPRNVAVFSAGGWGDVPVPLLKGSPPFSCPPKDIPLSFVGRLDGASDAGGLRSTMHAALREHALFTAGPHWREVMARSVFSLCPRGLGRASFRLYEALSVGSIPVYLWDDAEWLPYRDELDWSEIAVSLPISRVAELPKLLASYPPERIARMQSRIAALYDGWFTLEGASRRIVRTVEQLGDRNRFCRLMEARPFPPGVAPTREIPAFLRA